MGADCSLAGSAAALRPRLTPPQTPAALVVLRELEVEAEAVHADGDMADADPGVEPGAQGLEGSAIRRPREPGEAGCCSQEPAALVDHGYSITWSARSSTDCGMVSPTALAITPSMMSS